ncbi:hypothetical protein [Lysinibacillus sp. FSL P4-0201]|uniref:hypothetical protein n=1 Tax=Lysinibacillus sp. FSL P4-0201 TaxID=2921721 RepID=UPI00315AD212
MDTTTFIWTVIGGLVVAGLGFGATKIYNKNSIKNSQIQNGNENIGVYRSKNIDIGSEQIVRKDKNKDKK